MWLGKILGFFIGYLVGGWTGAFIGFLIGYFIDLRLMTGSTFTFSQGTHSGLQQMREAFFNATFLVMGHIAKADGHVNEQELQAARLIMLRMNLTTQQKQQAMHLFTEGKREGFDLTHTLTELARICRGNPILLQMFIDLQSQAAKLSGAINAEKRRRLEQIAQILGYRPFEFYYSGGSQQHSYTGAGASHTAATGKLTQAYSLLGVSRDTPDSEIKRAYRRLISQYHPDKLIAKGLPEEMIKIATEKAQNIQMAYDCIREARGF